MKKSTKLAIGKYTYLTKAQKARKARHAAKKACVISD